MKISVKFSVCLTMVSITLLFSLSGVSQSEISVPVNRYAEIISFKQDTMDDNNKNISDYWLLFNEVDYTKKESDLEIFKLNIWKEFKISSKPKNKAIYKKNNDYNYKCGDDGYLILEFDKFKIENDLNLK